MSLTLTRWARPGGRERTGCSPDVDFSTSAKEKIINCEKNGPCSQFAVSAASIDFPCRLVFTH